MKKENITLRNLSQEFILIIVVHSFIIIILSTF